MDKRCCEAADFFHFGQLDLSNREIHKLEELYHDLFCSPIGARSQRLSNRHFRKINLQILEDGYDTAEDSTSSDFGLRQQLALECIGMMKSIETIVLEITLLDYGGLESWSRIIKPAFNELANKIAGKVDKIELWIDSFSSSIESGEALNLMTTKIGQVVSSFPISLSKSIHLSGIEIDKVENSFAALINSPYLDSLTLKGCWGDFCNWLPHSLRTLSMSWEPSQHCSTPPPADYPLALLIMSYSAATLESVSLQNVDGIDYTRSLMKSRIVMAKLLHLELADLHLGQGSLLDVFILATATPELRTLKLTTTNALASDLYDLPEKVPTLRCVTIREGRVRSAPISGDASGYRATHKAFKEKNIALYTEYSCLRCDERADITCELFRIRSLAEDLVNLSLSVTSASLLGCDVFGAIALPKLRQLSICITIFTMPPNKGEEEEELGEEVPSLINLLNLLDATGLLELDLTLFAERNRFFLEELISVIKEGRFPKLETLRGVVVATNDIEDEEFILKEISLRHFCDRRGIYSAPMRFISRYDLLGCDGEESDKNNNEELEEAEDDEDGFSGEQPETTTQDFEQDLDEDEVEQQEEAQVHGKELDEERQRQEECEGDVDDVIPFENVGVNSTPAYQAKPEEIRSGARLRAALDNTQDSGNTDDHLDITAFPDFIEDLAANVKTMELSRNL